MQTSILLQKLPKQRTNLPLRLRLRIRYVRHELSLSTRKHRPLFGRQPSRRFVISHLVSLASDARTTAVYMLFTFAAESCRS